MAHEWGLLIVLYLFFGGLSAGLLALSSSVTLLRADRLERVASTAAWIAPWPVLAGTALLVLDLGQPFYFWKLLVAFEPRSPMWLGTWLLTLFSIVSLAYAYLLLPPMLRVWGPYDVGIWIRRLAMVGLPLGVGVGIYTGVLLGVLAARPLWNTPLLAQLFLISALSSASALLLAMLGRRATEDERRVLAISDIALIGLEMVVLAWIFADAGTSSASSSAAIALLAHGLYAWVFWVGVVLFGLLLPLGLEAAELRSGHRPDRSWYARTAALAPLLVLVGGFTLRWVMVYAGQASRL
jgi:protein NrfD